MEVHAMGIVGEIPDEDNQRMWDLWDAKGREGDFELVQTAYLMGQIAGKIAGVDAVKRRLEKLHG